MSKVVSEYALSITAIAIIIGYLWVIGWSFVESKRMKRKMSNHPKAGKPGKVYSKEVDRLLEMDDTEKFYHNN